MHAQPKGELGESFSTRLLVIDDADFEWMSEDAPGPRNGLTLPSGGVEDPAVLKQVRKMFRRLDEAGCRAHWMILSGREVVGLCSYKQVPKDGAAEIGYGIASSKRGMGHATRAVAELLRAAELDPEVRIVTAETSISNVASARVLEKNGFEQTGSRFDAEDGELIEWRRVIEGREEPDP